MSQSGPSNLQTPEYHPLAYQSWNNQSAFPKRAGLLITHVRISTEMMHECMVAEEDDDEHCDDIISATEGHLTCDNYSNYRQL